MKSGDVVEVRTLTGKIVEGAVVKIDQEGVRLASGRFFTLGMVRKVNGQPWSRQRQTGRQYLEEWSTEG